MARPKRGEKVIVAAMGKGGKKSKAAADSDDALLDAAIAENKANLEKLTLEKEQAEAEKAAKLKAAAEAAAAKDASAPAMTPPEICHLLDALPAFCIVDAYKRFVPVSIEGETVVIFWTEPEEAKSAAADAKTQLSLDVAIGTFPLGRAFAMCEGWATARGADRCILRAHAEVVAQFKPMLTKQLEQAGLPTSQLFPLFTCAELTTEQVMPFFLSRAEMVQTWEEAMRQKGSNAAPPEQMTVLDLRLLAHRMQTGGQVDWSIVRFVGTERAHQAVREAEKRQQEKVWAVQARKDDPDAEPPALT